MVRLIAISASRFDRLNSRAVATSCRSRSGYRSVNFTSREARKWLPKPSAAPIRRGRSPARNGSHPNRSSWCLDPAFPHIYGAIYRTCILRNAGQKGFQRDPDETSGRKFMRSIGHFIGGKEVKGTSGRTADVFEPMTGDVQAKVALASKAEVRAAVENARAAQVEWAATNPQRRGRVMMKFLELAQRDYDKLAERLAREHGKTVPDAKGDIQRGLEVVEFACGIPHLLKGEYTEGAGPGIDIYSMRQALGAVACITPFNFPAMIPMWKFAPAIACGNAFILKPSERDPGVPMELAKLM